jgi:branched-chain amino acid transport system ATP-binding protein
MTMTPLLDVQAISKRFGGVTAIDDLSISLVKGDRLGLVGPNGAGKTAFVNCVTGFYTLSGGSVHFDGVDISNLPLHKRGRLGLARTFQNIRLFKRMTVAENVACALRDHADRPFLSLLRFGGGARFVSAARDLLERVRLADKADQLAGSLPYGEARRLEIARALATRPRLLLLDEPTAGMNEQETQELLADLRANADLIPSMIVIEHDIGFIRDVSTRVVAMDYGRKIAEGSADEVFSHPQVVEAYLGRGEADV